MKGRSRDISSCWQTILNAFLPLTREVCIHAAKYSSLGTNGITQPPFRIFPHVLLGREKHSYTPFRHSIIKCPFSLSVFLTEQDRISDFELKLMDIDSEHLGIPKTEYNCIIQVGDRVVGVAADDYKKK